jgi:hypothetical protein
MGDGRIAVKTVVQDYVNTVDGRVDVKPVVLDYVNTVDGRRDVKIVELAIAFMECRSIDVRIAKCRVIHLFHLRLLKMHSVRLIS